MSVLPDCREQLSVGLKTKPARKALASVNNVDAQGRMNVYTIELKVGGARGEYTLQTST